MAAVPNRDPTAPVGSASLSEYVPCGRCNAKLRYGEIPFFCSVCVGPMCDQCLYYSFENGLLKCSKCCPAPLLSVLFRSNAVRTTLQKQDVPSLLAALGVAEPAVASPYRDLKRDRVLGEGAQGVVYQCTTAGGETVAVKAVPFDDEREFQAQKRHAERIMKLKHNHLIRYLDVYEERSPLRLIVVMPYYDEGDLKEYIGKQRRPIPEDKLCSIVLQIAEALAYLHSQSPPLIHRDVKPDNILLLNNTNQVLLMDLDLCGPDETATLMRCRGEPTFEYKAPEPRGSQKESGKADVFSLGAVTYSLARLPDFLTLKNDKREEVVLSHPGWTEASLEAAIRREIGSVRGYTYSTRFVDLLVQMLRHDPSKRPNAQRVTLEMRTLMENRLLGQS